MFGCLAKREESRSGAKNVASRVSGWLSGIGKLESPVRGDRISCAAAERRGQIILSQGTARCTGDARDEPVSL
jgi:hypothetical protein